MQSANYVPGISGWKIKALTGEFELADGDRVITGKDPHCQVTTRLPMSYVKRQVSSNGQYVAAGVGLDPGEAKPDLADAIKSRDAGAIFDAISSAIGESELSSGLLAEIAKISTNHVGGINERLEKLSLEVLADKGESCAARIRTEQRLEAIELAVSLLKLR